MHSFLELGINAEKSLIASGHLGYVSLCKITPATLTSTSQMALSTSRGLISPLSFILVANDVAEPLRLWVIEVTPSS